ncbi:hypothetical protein YC2023_091195 [Brassica napus]
METTTPSAPVHPQVNANLLISNSGTDTRVAQNLSNNLDKESALVHSQQPNVTTFQDNTLVLSDHIRRYILGDFITFHFSLSKNESGQRKIGRMVCISQQRGRKLIVSKYIPWRRGTSLLYIARKTGEKRHEDVPVLCFPHDFKL